MQRGLKSKEEVIKRLKDKYKIIEIEEAYDEIDDLVTDGSLYSEDLYEKIALDSGNSASYIKALCLNIAHDCNLRCKYCFGR